MVVNLVPPCSVYPGSSATYADLTVQEAGQLAGQLAKCIAAGTYRPRAARHRSIPKASGRGFRTLTISTIGDRIVAKALHNALSPLCEPLFLDGSYGFRTGRGTWDMLADLELAITQEDRCVLAVDDIRAAFDRLPIVHAIDAHRRLLLEIAASDNQRREHLQPHNSPTNNTTDFSTNLSRPLDMIATVLRGYDQNRQVGIDQGSPYSPLALNVTLHYAHDLHFSRHYTTPITNPQHEHALFAPRWFRYADNLVYACRDASEGQRALEDARQLLEANQLALKGEDGVFDLLAGDSAQILGLTIRKGKRGPELGLGTSALDGLAQAFTEAHEAPDPNENARARLCGWVSAYGPAFREGGRPTDEILSLAVHHGFRELCARHQLKKWQEESWTGWQRKRRAAMRRYREKAGE